MQPPLSPNIAPENALQSRQSTLKVLLAAFFDRRLARLGLFAGTALAAILVMMVPCYLSLGYGTCIFVPLYPMGLFVFVPLHSMGSVEFDLIIGVAWVIYFGLAIWGTMTKSRRRFVNLFGAFTIMVFLNMAGCAAQV